MDFSNQRNEYFKLDFLCKELSKEEGFKGVADLFSLLSDTNRLKIFWFLCHSKECGQNIANAIGMTNPAVSHHLKILRESGLIECYRDGKEVFYFAEKSETCLALHEIIEKLMSMTCPDFDGRHEKVSAGTEYLDNQVSKIKKVHDYMMENLSKRITIDELSKRFAVNATTLKTVFKDVYGSSIAAHIKEHRMEKAAELLRTTDKSVGEVAFEVGYESQSKFGVAFKESFCISPMEYKRGVKSADGKPKIAEKEM